MSWLSDRKHLVGLESGWTSAKGKVKENHGLLPWGQQWGSARAAKQTTGLLGVGVQGRGDVIQAFLVSLANVGELPVTGHLECVCAAVCIQHHTSGLSCASCLPGS